LYARACAGELEYLTGVSAPFEVPEHPELVIDMGAVDREDAARRLLHYVAAAVGPCESDVARRATDRAVAGRDSRSTSSLVT